MTMPQPAVSPTDDLLLPTAPDPTDPVATSPTGIAVLPVGAMRLNEVKTKLDSLIRAARAEQRPWWEEMRSEGN